MVPALAPRRGGGRDVVRAGVYARFGVRRWTVRRWTALLAYPAVLVQVPLTAYALGRRTFVWGGRHYRWRGKFDVEVVDAGE